MGARSRLLFLAALLLSTSLASAQQAESEADHARKAPVIERHPISPRFDLQRWGLAASDFSLLHDRALARKAGLPGRSADLAQAARSGDPYATYLVAVEARLAGNAAKASDYSAKASSMGVVRGLTDLGVDAFGRAKDADDFQVSNATLFQAAATGNAYSAYWYGKLRMARNPKGDSKEYQQGLRSLVYAARAGFAPAQLDAARMLFADADKGGAPAVALARTFLDAAVLQGLPEAVEFAKTQPKP